MFTGLVQGTGTLHSLAGGALRVDATLDLAEGDSVAVNGVCLTARAVEPAGFAADVMEETLRRTALGRLADGDRVNLELALRAGDRLGGHIVQGHVDGTGVVEAVSQEGIGRLLRLSAAPELLRYVVEKGSIAVDGVSLTVTSVDDEGFAVSLVPETVERTTLGTLEPGRLVNLEVDLVAKYVEKLAAVRPSPSRREDGLVA